MATRCSLDRYKLVCQSFTQDSKPNFDTEYALLDVFKGGKKITQLAPERRFYIASQTSSTMVALHSTLAQDLYVIYEGKNPDTDKPIIKVFHQSTYQLDMDRGSDRRHGNIPCTGPESTRAAPARATASVTSPAISEAEVNHA